MPLHVPWITKVCSVVAIMIALGILIETLFFIKEENRPYRQRWILLAISFLTWGGLVWLPLLPSLAEVAVYRNTIHLLRLFFMVFGVWVFVGLYRAGQLNLRKSKPGKGSGQVK